MASETQNDDQVLLSAKEMAEKKSDDSQKDLCFEDGERKIDCIIAYEVLVDDEDAATKEAHRESYFKNLEKRGLQIEKADCKQVYLGRTNSHLDLFTVNLSSL